MLEGKTVAVVVPAYDEEALVGTTIRGIPAFVDRIFVVDDASRDGTVEAARAVGDPRVAVLTHDRNAGVGGAIVTGYRRSVAEGIDVACVMAADNQMDPSDLERIALPVARGEVSGYWHVADSQSGYTAASREILEQLDLDRIYRGYGFPNDMLVHLNVWSARVRDVTARPVYGVGERSGIKIRKVVPRISWLLLKGFFWRMREKYVIRDFHPLVFFYVLGFLMTFLGLGLGIAEVVLRIMGNAVSVGTVVLVALLLIFGSQFTLFAMWFDMESNKDLR